MKPYKYFFLALLVPISCNSQDPTKKLKTYNPEAVTLNNIAMDVFTKNSGNHDSLLKAIDILNQAIQKDTSYYMAYSNKASLLCSIGDISEAIITLDQIIKINNDLLEIKTLKGYMLEKLGNKNQAIQIYKDVLYQYDLKLNTDKSNVKLMLNRAFLYFFINDDNKAITEYNRISKLYPNNMEVEYLRSVFNSFNKTEFLDSICISE